MSRQKQVVRSTSTRRSCNGAACESGDGQTAGEAVNVEQRAGHESTSHSLAGREVVLGVAGGVACFKAAALASLLAKQSVGVTAVLTEAATRFVGEATFAALTGRPVKTRLFEPQHHPLGGHIELVTKADLVVVAPATADILGKAACGLADDLLSTLLLAAECPVLFAPAMNAAMWGKPAVQRNVRQVLEDGAGIIEPSSGWLACRRDGTGRMAEPESILEAITDVLASGRVPRPAAI